MYEVTIERKCGDESRVWKRGECLGFTLYAALRGTDEPRVEQVLARAIDAFVVWDGLGSEAEPWPGYHKAVRALADAAEAVVNGWRKHDKERDIA
jgi:hypothetical protein